LAHIAIAARPGAELDVKNMAPELVDQFQRRQRSQFTALATAPAGCIAGFAIEPVEPPDLSATAVRSLLRTDPAAADNLLPPGVLDYIRRNHLYTD
jgi:nicotinic acid mononucleotide adenylyltransferase